MHVPFSPPRIDDAIKQEVIAALESGWITTGPRTKLFEQQLAEYVGVEKVHCSNAATNSMLLVLYALGLKKGDEVIVPAYTYAATANVVVHCGAVPVFADVTSDFLIDVQHVERLITPKTKAIIPVDIAGMPCNYEAIMQVILSKQSLFKAESDFQQKLNRIALVADAAHSIGATIHGIPTAKYSDFTCYSFHAVKNLTTAEGGAIAFNLPEPFSNQELYTYLNIMSLHGQTKDALAKTKAGSWEYDIIAPGFKCNMTDLQAAIGLIELKRYQNDTLVVRKKQFDYYNQLLTNNTNFITPIMETENKVGSYHLYQLRLSKPSEELRNYIIQFAAQRNVALNVHFKPLPLFSYYKNRGYSIDNYPNAHQLFQSEISLPIFYDLTQAQQDYVVETLQLAIDSWR